MKQRHHLDITINYTPLNFATVNENVAEKHSVSIINCECHAVRTEETKGKKSMKGKKNHVNLVFNQHLKTNWTNERLFAFIN